jgi:auxin influx carrier (AUX1 LAX family)
MFKPSMYDRIYPFSYIFTYIVTVPHALLTQLAFPNANGVQGPPPHSFQILIM